MIEAERLRSKHKKDFPDYKYQPRRRKPTKPVNSPSTGKTESATSKQTSESTSLKQVAEATSSTCRESTRSSNRKNGCPPGHRRTSANGSSSCSQVSSFTSHPKHVQSDRQTSNHFTRAHILTPPPTIQGNQHYSGGIPTAPHHQSPMHPHHFRFLQGQPFTSHEQFLASPGHPHVQQPGHHGMMHHSGHSFTQQSIPSENASEHTQESQLSSNFTTQTSDGNPHKPVFQFHTQSGFPLTQPLPDPHPASISFWNQLWQES